MQRYFRYYIFLFFQVRQEFFSVSYFIPGDFVL